MAVRIELPKMHKQLEARAHLYPFQIGIQTLGFIQGALFFAILTDLASGQRVRQPGAMESLEKEMRENGLPQKNIDQGWALLEEYKTVFLSTVFQNALIAMRSHWDWYIRKLGAFVLFARQSSGALPLSRRLQDSLNGIGYKEISQQVLILQQCTGLSLSIPPDNLEVLSEMSLVRNLGLHNRWEVDGVYLSRSGTRERWSVGDIRTIEASELRLWHQALMNLINSTSSPVAQLYVNAPDYPA